MTRATSSGGVRIEVTGARGESFGAVARRVSNVAGVPILSTDTDAQILDKMGSGAAADRIAAEQAADIAEIAALTAPQVYATTAAGLAAVPSGGTFWVAEAGGLRLYRDDAGTATALDVVLTKSALAGDGGASLIGTAEAGTVQEALDIFGELKTTAMLTPEMFGAVGYPTLADAQAGTSDSTAAMQALFNEASAKSIIANGNDRWYRVGTVYVPSELTAMNIKTFSLPSTQDNSPFFIDGQTVKKRNITLVDCGGHGNRENQSQLITSNFDGQRAIFKIWGQTENVHLIRPWAFYAATDGIFVWHAFYEPANGTDYCHRDLVIQDPDCQWNGRHGISLSSIYRGKVCSNGIGFLANNGKDLPGASGGGYTDGRYGRRTPANLSGLFYGRPITFESFLNGDGFDTMEWTGLDCRGNASGALILHLRHETPCYRLRVTNCQFDDPLGGNGDGAFITTATDFDTGVTYTGSDGIVDAAFAGNKYYRNAPFLRNIFGLTVADTLSSVDPAVSAYGFNLAATVQNVAYFSCPSNRAINGLVSPISIQSVAQIMGSSWSATPQDLRFLGFTVLGQLKFHLPLTVTSDAAELGAFDVFLPSGWADISDVRVEVTNNDTAEPVLGGARRSSNAANAVTFRFKATAAHVHLVDLYFTAAKP
ncbi:hypothetical protein [Sphingomonas xinjiangensis]|uniref:Uncharacterized protein n=1 Tax=Sphingomonas xinjiangensis TaxID=643568 RepID=A0A840YK06_9SPHN|nr:hypothetical protein [Sphingomonas xinjiangensis]MBB5709356.1 hypothetical protein [Sphingomonas xinjiangensis]